MCLYRAVQRSVNHYKKHNLDNMTILTTVKGSVIPPIENPFSNIHLNSVRNRILGFFAYVFVVMVADGVRCTNDIMWLEKKVLQRCRF